MAEETQTVIQREAPEIEAYKLGLLEQAKDLTSAPPTGGLPDYEVAGLDQAQSTLGSMAPTYFVAVAGIVAAFFGAQAFTKK